MPTTAHVSETHAFVTVTAAIIILCCMSFDPNPLFAERIRTMRPSLVRELLKRATSPEIISFAGGLPNPRFFPSEHLAEATGAVLRRDGPSVLQYAVSEGYPPLRAWIAERYRQRYNVTVPVEDILITSGSQQALDLIGKVMIDPGNPVIIERPGYQGMIHALSLYQPRFVGVTLNADGMDTDELDATLAKTQAGLVMACPNYQNPSGISYTDANRQAVAAVVARHRTMLVEDDPYAELGFGDDVSPSFRGLLPEQCFALGSFSKIAAPGMRLGWVIAPQHSMERLIVAKQATDFHASNFAQRALHEYLVTQNIDDHIRTMRKAYETQCAAMLAAISKHLPPGITHTTPVGGMFIWLTLPEGADTMVLLNSAIDAGVTFLPGAVFFTDGGGARNLRLSFSQADPDRIDIGIQRLARAIVEHLDGVEVQQ
jgi:2-aminoadipate transaminase